MKDECYTEYKHARGIYSRTDEFKTIVGPWFRQIDKVLFSHPDFVKKVPHRERPKYLMEKLTKHLNLIFVGTDWSSMEAHYDEMMFELVFLFYEHMVSKLPNKDWFLKYIREAFTKFNHCSFKWLTVYIWCCLMSGEMCTSCQNGFVNWIVLRFLHHKTGNTNLERSVEGDDSAASFHGKVPDKEIIDKLGLVLKLEVCEDVNTMSFCGNVFDPDELSIITDPRVELVSFGWTSQRYINASYKRRMELLRSKALSMLYQYDGCPILGALGRYGLRVTEGFRARAPVTNLYEKELITETLEWIRMNGVPNSMPGPKTRELVEKLYSISVQDQIDYENYLDSLTVLQPLQPLFLDMYLSDVWKNYYSHYHLVGTTSDNILPPFINTRITKGPNGKWKYGL